jgi:hypothetical protein
MEAVMNAVGPAVEELTVGQAVLILGAIVAVIEAIRRAWPWARDFVLFLVEIVGAPPRSGRPARPGLIAVVMQLSDRLGAVEDAVSRVEETATAAASASVAANEKADRISTQVDDVRALAEDVRDQQHALAAEQTQIRTALEELRAQGTDAPTLPIPQSNDPKE